ncbi:MAG: response regulator, partial [Chloroflexi bacterium]
MAEAKHILVVDDHFEMLEFLRSMLEMSNQDYEVLAVPSAEEGLFELQRAQFDLIITDVRLPGMSGFDLVRRLQRLGHKSPIIMITAYSSTQGQKEAEELGVYRYFKKPLDTDDVLTAVHNALHGESVAQIPQVSLEQSVVPDASSAVQKRLETLRADTGAVLLMLASIQGNIIYADGELRQVELPGLAEIIARNIKDSFLLAEKLDSKEPFSLQYHAGSRIELYCANVGKDHFLTLFFETNLRRGRIGTIWLFTQRAINDLLQLLVARHEDKAAPVPVQSAPDAVNAFLQDTFDSLIDESVQETAVPVSIPQLPSQPPPIPEPPVIPEETVPEIRLELDPLDVED